MEYGGIVSNQGSSIYGVKQVDNTGVFTDEIEPEPPPYLIATDGCKIKGFYLAIEDHVYSGKTKITGQEEDKVEKPTDPPLDPIPPEPPPSISQPPESNLLCFCQRTSRSVNSLLPELFLLSWKLAMPYQP